MTTPIVATTPIGRHFIAGCGALGLDVYTMATTLKNKRRATMVERDELILWMREHPVRELGKVATLTQIATLTHLPIGTICWCEDRARARRAELESGRSLGTRLRSEPACSHDGPARDLQAVDNIEEAVVKSGKSGISQQAALVSGTIGTQPTERAA